MIKRMTMTDQEYHQRLADARKTNQERDQSEYESNLASPHHCPLDCHLRTVEMALECGVKMKDWSCVLEGIAMLQVAISRIPRTH